MRHKNKGCFTFEGETERGALYEHTSKFKRALAKRRANANIEADGNRKFRLNCFHAVSTTRLLLLHDLVSNLAAKLSQPV